MTEKAQDNYKWLIVSGLQKSIRMGLTDEALSCAMYLTQTDKSYLQYRLGIILTEDVGVANMDLVEKYLNTEIKKKNIEELGGFDFIKSIIEEACSSVKDRSSCDAAYTAGFNDILINQPLEQQKDIVFNPNYDSVCQIKILWNLLGTKKYQKFYSDEKTEKDNLEETLLFISESLNSAHPNSSREVAQVCNIFEKSYKTQRENILLGIPIVFNHYMYEKSLSEKNKIEHLGKIVTKTHDKEDLLYHKPTHLFIPSSAVDGHTYEGKQCYFRFLKTHTEFKKYLQAHKVPFDSWVDVLKHMVFRVEGHEVNKRVYFPTASNIMKDCSNVALRHKSLGCNLNFNELSNIIKEELPKLKTIRQEFFHELKEENKYRL